MNADILVALEVIEERLDDIRKGVYEVIDVVNNQIIETVNKESDNISE